MRNSSVRAQEGTGIPGGRPPAAATEFLRMRPTLEHVRCCLRSRGYGCRSQGWTRGRDNRLGAVRSPVSDARSISADWRRARIAYRKNGPTIPIKAGVLSHSPKHECRELAALSHGQSHCSPLATATSPVGRLSELVHPLVGQPKHARGIAGAQSQTTPAQHANCSPGSNRGTPVLPICLLSECCVRPDCLRSPFRQSHIINDLRCSRIVDEQLQGFRDSAARFVDRAALRVATPHAANRSYPPP